MKAIYRFLGMFIFCCGFAQPAPALAEDDSLKSYRVKAAFVYNFLNFTTLPNEAGSELIICTASNAIAQEAFASLSGKKVRNARIKIKYVDPNGDFSNCAVTFVSSDFYRRSKKILSNSSSANLTIGESDTFCDGQHTK